MFGEECFSMRMPKILKRVATAVCALALAVGIAGCGGSGEKEQFINIATGGTAGTYYPIGGAIAEVLNKNGVNAFKNFVASSANENISVPITTSSVYFFPSNLYEAIKSGTL